MKRAPVPRSLWAASVAMAVLAGGCGAAQHVASSPASVSRLSRQPRAVAVALPRRAEDPETAAMAQQRLLRRSEARVEACRKAHDLRPFEADVVGRYHLQGRISDVSMSRWLELLATRAARLSAARGCIMQREGGTVSIPSHERLLPVLHQATLGLLSALVSHAPGWANALDGSRDPAATAWRDTWRRDPSFLLPQDGPWAPSVSATQRFEVLDVQVVEPSPLPVVDERGRAVALEVPLTVVMRPQPALGALPGLCLHRFVTEVRPVRGPRSLRVWPQWRVATCPAAPATP